MVSRWIEHVKKYASKHKMSYKEAMSKARASYKPVKKGGAMVGMNGHGMKPCNLERMIGGAKMMPLPQLKKEVKSLGHKLSRVVDGVRKAYNKKELMSKLVAEDAMEGGKFSFKQLASDAGKISKKILKTAVPVVAGLGTTIETGNPMAGMAAAKGATELTNYVLGAGKKRRKKKE
jgi:hypothetical protein